MDLCRYEFDRQIAGGPGILVAGTDEAGRGPLAGPVVAAAVMFKPDAPFLGVNDSKALSPSTRLVLFREILSSADIGLGVADEATIDRINIYQATRLAMRQAVMALPRQPDLVLSDGNMTLEIPYRQESVVQGDLKSAVIGAASIVAKVYRDHWMEGLEPLFPDYGFGSHKGYATPEHLKALQSLGPTPFHRRTFAPVQELLQQKLL